VKVIAAASIKGGVGKTATAVNLAAEATRAGVRVLLWDLDPQGSATYLLRAEHHLSGGGVRGLVDPKAELAPHVRATSVPGLHVVPSDLSLRFLDRHLDAAGKPRRRIGTLLSPLAMAYDPVDGGSGPCGPSTVLPGGAILSTSGRRCPQYGTSVRWAPGGRSRTMW